MKNKLFHVLEINYPIIVFLYFVVSMADSLDTVGTASTFLVGNSLVNMLFKTVVSLSFIIVSLLLLRYKKVLIDRHLVFVCLLIVAFGSIPIWFPTTKTELLSIDGETIVDITAPLSLKLRSELSIFRFAFGAFYFCFASRFIITGKELKKTFALIVLFSFYCVVYMLVFQHNYLFSDTYSSKARSIFANKNTFGMLLFVSTILCFILIHKYKLRFLYVVALVFYFSSLITYCRTTFLILTLLFIFALLFFGIKKRNNKIGKVVLITFIIGIIVLLSLLGVLINTNLFDSISLLAKVKSYILNFYSTLTENSESNRIVIWAWTFKYMLSNSSFVFGYGPNISNETLRLITSVSTTSYGTHAVFHNSFVQTLSSGGVIRMTMLLYLCYVYALKNVNFKNKKQLAYMQIVLLACLVMYQFSESIELFGDSGMNFAISLLFMSYLFNNRRDCNSNIFELTI